MPRRSSMLVVLVAPVVLGPLMPLVGLGCVRSEPLAAPSAASPPPPPSPAWTSAPVPPPGADLVPAGFVQLAAGADFACGLTKHGVVYCWGDGRFGQTGSREAQEVGPWPRAVPGLERVARLGVGRFHACALWSSGAAACWGHNAVGLLGNGDELDSPVPVEVVGLPGPILALGSGATVAHGCAVLASGALWCWGSNDHGQLGDGTITRARTRPRPVAGLEDVRGFAVGYIHTCAVDAGGRVSCWGWNPHGLVDSDAPDTADFTVPRPKAGLADVVQLTAGNHHSCARHASGKVSCWGFEGQGQLGDGSGHEHAEPRPVAGLDDAVDLASGGSHSCAVRREGTVVCWGRNYYGQLGNGTTEDQPRPVEVVGLHDALDVEVGADFSCALSRTQGASCWGRNHDGQLGDGTTEDRLTPAPVVLPP
ncbi:MAG: hypothetical protein KDK70_03845 [Myxococcales bacterium]|nr:hypothetical protein [Myxococcales bacterium]